MSQEKIFVGRVETREGQYGPMTSISFGPQDMEKIQANLNAAGWINLSLKESKAGTPYLEVFQPRAKVDEAPKATADLPF